MSQPTRPDYIMGELRDRLIAQGVSPNLSREEYKKLGHSINYSSGTQSFLKVRTPSPMMPPKTLAALQNSIAKWREVAAGADERGWTDCPLCLLFLVGPNGRPKNRYDDPCVGCPVSAHTNKPYCKGTPYDAWIAYDPPYSEKASEKRTRLAQAELDFLISLLPPGGEPTPSEPTP